MWALSTCGEQDEIKKNAHPKNITALLRDQGLELHRVEHVGKACAADAGEETWRCLVGQYRMRHLTTPFWVLQDQYDAYVI